MNLGAWLEKANKSQKALAAEVGLTPGMISHVVCGRASVAPENVLKIAAATGYEVRPHDMLPNVYPFPSDGVPPSASDGHRAAAAPST